MPARGKAICPARLCTPPSSQPRPQHQIRAPRHQRSASSREPLPALSFRSADQAEQNSRWIVQRRAEAGQSTVVSQHGLSLGLPRAGQFNASSSVSASAEPWPDADNSADTELHNSLREGLARIEPPNFALLHADVLLDPDATGFAATFGVQVQTDAWCHGFLGYHRYTHLYVPVPLALSAPCSEASHSQLGSSSVLNDRPHSLLIGACRRYADRLVRPVLVS